MLKIRLTRTGKKKKPTYRIVVAEHQNPIQGKFTEIVGHYDPFTKKVVLNKEKVLSWMNKGAKPSNTVAKLFKKEGIEHKSIVIKTFKSKSKKELEAEKKIKEEEKAKEQAEKEVKKAEFEKEVEEKKQEAEAEKVKEEAESNSDKSTEQEKQADSTSNKEESVENAPASAEKGKAE
jgi:small subunit ribosomal protein S16